MIPIPYVDPETRRALTYGDADPESPGQLNYAITLEIVSYVDRKGLSYQAINDVLGALEGAKLEFYRRVAVPYEDDKIRANGDVY